MFFNRKKPDDPRILAQLITAYSQFDPEKAKLYPCDYIALIDVLKNEVFQELHIITRIMLCLLTTLDIFVHLFTYLNSNSSVKNKIYIL